MKIIHLKNQTIILLIIRFDLVFCLHNLFFKKAKLKLKKTTEIIK